MKFPTGFIKGFFVFWLCLFLFSLFGQLSAGEDVARAVPLCLIGAGVISFLVFLVAFFIWLGIKMWKSMGDE